MQAYPMGTPCGPESADGQEVKIYSGERYLIDYTEYFDLTVCVAQSLLLIRVILSCLMGGGVLVADCSISCMLCFVAAGL